jgi:hypothetical protein
VDFLELPGGEFHHGLILPGKPFGILRAAFSITIGGYEESPVHFSTGL